MTRFVKLALLALLLATAGLASVYWLPLSDWITRLLGWVALHPRLAWPVFVLAYVIATVAAIPGTLFTLGSGFLFGLPVGIVLTSIGSTLGACSAFLVGRYLARDWVAQRISSRRGFLALDLATRHEGFKIVLLTRLSPVFPFNLLNYVLGLTAVRFRDYALATWLGMLPLTVLYVSLGAAAGDLHEILAGNVDTGLAGPVIAVVGLTAAIAVTVLVTRTARRALDRHLRAEAVVVTDDSR
ncbi:MAG TPA: TVP38/TMEM64 family protein [Gammaproteobacteria bacterium]|nr:TVP38/TMEM64 family protein [Gammaproteobacteria bacterium]